jgi:hypothetical protein
MARSSETIEGNKETLDKNAHAIVIAAKANRIKNVRSHARR